MDWVESAEAIGQVDELLASVGLGHGKRKTLGGTWADGERVVSPPKKASYLPKRNCAEVVWRSSALPDGRDIAGCGTDSAPARAGSRKFTGMDP